jgi:hypothetical protein
MTICAWCDRPCDEHHPDHCATRLAVTGKLPPCRCGRDVEGDGTHLFVAQRGEEGQLPFAGPCAFCTLPRNNVQHREDEAA